MFDDTVSDGTDELDDKVAQRISEIEDDLGVQVEYEYEDELEQLKEDVEDLIYSSNDVKIDYAEVYSTYCCNADLVADEMRNINDSDIQISRISEGDKIYYEYE